MLLLNDDCLCYIFGKLKLREQLSLAAVCERFRDLIVGMLWRSRFRRFATTGNSETDKLNCQEFQSLFELILHTIEELVITDPQQVTYTSYLTRYTWRPELAFYLSFEFPVLRVLECHDLRLHDGHVRLLAAHCPLIERLNVVSPYVTGEHIASMRHLRVLKAFGCSLRTSHLEQILTELPVTELGIAENNTNNPSDMAKVLMSAPDLQDLWLYMGTRSPDLLFHMIAMASPSKRRHTLTVHIDKYADLTFKKHAPNEAHAFGRRRAEFIVEKFSNPKTHSVSVSDQYITFRFSSEELK